MKKAIITIRTDNGMKNIEGYAVSKDFGIVKRGNGYAVTDMHTGFNLSTVPYATIKDCLKAGIEEGKKKIEHYKIAKPEAYADLVLAFDKATGKKEVEAKGVKTTKTRKEGAKMNKKTAKKTATKKTAKKVEKPNEVETLKKEVEELKAVIEALTKSLEPKVEPKVEKPKAKKTRKPKITIDTFNIDMYLEERENDSRITEGLVNALKNTKGLKIEFKGEDKWLYVRGETEEDTRSRKELFKEMGFRWSGREGAWFIAPYPIANAKRWANKKNRKAA